MTFQLIKQHRNDIYLEVSSTFFINIGTPADTQCETFGLISFLSLFLSDSTSQFLQHRQAFLVVLGLAQPEGVLVFHYVGQHCAAQEHHVFTPGRVLDADLKLLCRGRAAEERFSTD